VAAELSEAARGLLLEDARDPSGLILRLIAPGGSALLRKVGQPDGDPDLGHSTDGAVDGVVGVWCRSHGGSYDADGQTTGEGAHRGR
jgi:hypothetical protein